MGACEKWRMGKCRCQLNDFLAWTVTKRIFLNIVICDLQLEQVRNIASLVWVTSRQSHDIAGFAYPLCNFQLSLSRPLLRLTMENDVAALVRPLF